MRELPDSRRSTPPSPDRLTVFWHRFRLPRSVRGTILVILGLWAGLVAADTLLAQSGAAARADLGARLAAAFLENRTGDDLAALRPRLERALDPDLNVVATDRDGTALFARSVGAHPPLSALPPVAIERSIAGPLGTVAIAIGQDAVLTPVLLRALASLVAALALIVYLVGKAGAAEKRQRGRALGSVLDMVSDGVVLWDQDHRLAAANAGLRRIPVLPDALLRRGIGYKAFYDGLRQAGDLTLVATTRNARRLHLTTTAGDAWDLCESFSEDGILVTRFIDDGERTRLHEEVVRLNHRLGEITADLQTQRVRGDAASRSKRLFLGQLSHSLRTPLNHIIGFADLLRHQSYGPLGDERYLNYAGNIQQSGEALLDVISNMLELAEFDAGQRVLARETIRLNELMDWTLGRYGEQARRAGLTFTLERSGEMVIIGDKQCLKRLIGNVVENSLKFTPAGGSLVFAAWPAEDGVVLEFTDTGIGIAAETLNILNSSFALGGESRGNGIAIARAIAELSGGQLEINSSPGIGTTVAVVLPARPAEGADQPARSATRRRVA